MNQHRWTCLITVVLATVLSPIANVHASTRSFSSAKSGASYIPVSPHSLPTITPLVVTELETDLVIRAQVTPVPLVSKLPIVKVITNQSKSSARSARRESKKDRIAKFKSQPTVAKLPAVNPIFNSNVRVTDPAFPIANPTNSVMAIVIPVAPLPLPKVAPASKTPTFISPVPTVATIRTRVDKIQANSTPQFAPIIRDIKDHLGQAPIQGTELPVFEAGTSTLGMNNDKTSQIVVTAIAQVGDTIVAPEPSIAIPVEQPKQQPTTPNKLPATVPATVKIGQPAATVKPALDKIVATQSGQASWYGIEGGPKTASGERYNPSGLTAAHRTLPFGTKVRVTSLKTGKTVIVRINDRGPVSRRRVIDISAGAAEAIGIKNDGIGQVRMDVLDREG